MTDPDCLENVIRVLCPHCKQINQAVTGVGMELSWGECAYCGKMITKPQLIETWKDHP